MNGAIHGRISRLQRPDLRIYTAYMTLSDSQLERFMILWTKATGEAISRDGSSAECPPTSLPVSPLNTTAARKPTNRAGGH